MCRRRGNYCSRFTLIALNTYRPVIVPSEPCTYPHILLSLDKHEQHTLDMTSKMHTNNVIIDEKLGRNIAEYLGLDVTGALGVLLKAKQ